MPQMTLSFAEIMLGEMIELRNELPKYPTGQEIEVITDKERSFRELLLELADNSLICAAAPELIADEEQDIRLIAFLILVIWQASDWQSDVAIFIENEVKKDIAFFGGIHWLPEASKVALIKSAAKQNGSARRLAAMFCARNHFLVNEIDWVVEASFNRLSTEEIMLFAQLGRDDCHSMLLHSINDNEISLPQALTCALALMQYQDSRGLDYLRRPEVIAHPASGYGEWLASFATQQDLRLIEQTIEQQIEVYQQSPTQECLQSIVGMIQSLAHQGDARVAIWCYRQLLSQRLPRLRFEGFKAMLGLFDPDLVAKGYLILGNAATVTDELGGFGLLEAQDSKMYWDELQQQVGKQQILPSCRCRSGKPYDQLSDIIEQLGELTYGDNQTADRLRLQVGILIEQTMPLDSYAPYQVFIEQQSAMISEVERFRLSSQYQAGSFKRW